MEQIPCWEANSRSAIREIQCLYGIQSFHKSRPPISVLIQMDPVHTLPPYFLKIHYNIILPSPPRSSKWSLPFRFPDLNTVRIAHLPMRATWPAHSTIDNHHHLNNIWWRVQIFSSSPAASRSNECRGFFPGGKAVDAFSCPPTSI
jgi:hypothetical protein